MRKFKFKNLQKEYLTSKDETSESTYEIYSALFITFLAIKYITN